MSDKKVVCEHLGKFYHIDNAPNPENEVYFVPKNYILEDVGLTYAKLHSIEETLPSLDVTTTEIKVSYSAISHVCGTDRESVKAILKDFLDKVFQLAKEGKIIELNMLVGALKFSGRLISFITYPDGIPPSQIMAQSIYSDHRGKSADHAHSFHLDTRSRRAANSRPITSASARSNLSFTSSRSSAYSSAYTPHSSKFTRPSTRSSSSSVRTAMMSHPLGRSIQSRGSERRYRNPDVLYREDPLPSMPYPFLKSMAEPSGKKFTKKMVREDFTNSTTVVESHQSQLERKAKDKLKDKFTDKVDQKSKLESIKEELMKERILREQKIKDYRQNILEENKVQVEQKQKRRRDQKEKDKGEKVDFFPFTHGEDIEKKRVEMNESMKKDMMGQMQTKAREADTKKFDKEDLQYKSEVPVFLKLSKAHPVRRIDHSHVEETMKTALKNYEQRLRQKEVEKKQEIYEVNAQAENNKLYFEAMELRRVNEKLEQRAMLERQMVEVRQRKQREKTKQKEKSGTSFGPEEDEEMKKLMRAKERQQKSEINQFLKSQMADKSRKLREEKDRDREEDAEMLMKANMVIEREKVAKKEKESYNKGYFLETWKQQIKLKELEDQKTKS